MHRDRARQIVDFSGMLFNYKITPTDIDGLIEYRNKCFVFFEIKYKNDEGVAPLPFGQGLALKRIVDSLNKPAVLLIASHCVFDYSVDIDAAKCIVERYYWMGEWYKPRSKTLTLKTACDNFIKKYSDR